MVFLDQFYFNNQQQNQQQNLQAEIESLNTQILFMLILIGSISLSIYIIEEYKYLLMNGQNARHTQEELQDYAIIASTITTIVTSYFLYVAFKTYKSQPTASNAIFLLVAVLIVIATVLRTVTLAATPFENVNDDFV